MKKRKKKAQQESPMSQMTAPLRASAKAFNWKLALIVVLNTIIIFGFYRLMLNFYYFEIVMGIYLALTAIFVFTYVIYNRGFTRRHITPDMLPDEWTEEQKNAYIADGVNRMQKSKWMLTVIFPLVLTFMFDCIELFWGDLFARLFQS
jgi:Ca2+/Na+ antiporter